MSGVVLSLNFGSIEEAAAALAKLGVNAAPAIITPAPAVEPAAKPKRGRPAAKQEISADHPALDAAAKAAEPAPAVEQPAAPTQPKSTHAEVRAALVAYASATSNEQAKGFLPAGCAAVKDLTEEQCAAVLKAVADASALM